MKYIVVFLVVLSFYSCENIKNRSVKQNIDLSSNSGFKILQGNWIMTNYMDTIMKTKSIENAVKGYLNCSGIVLKIQKDSIYYEGLLFKGSQKINNLDSITTINGFLDYDYQLIYKEETGRIETKYIISNPNEIDSIQYSFRRIKKEEKSLFDENKDLSVNFNSFFIKKLIAGEYKLVDDEEIILKLKSNKETSGFKKYSSYNIHDYFGTSHPFNSEDVIIFKDANLKGEGNKPPKNINIFSWEFKEDYFVLTEMLTENYDRYFKGKKKYRFKKIK